MMEMVYVGNERLVGEVIGITSELTTIQVYEETTGLRPGEPVVGTGSPMNVTLGPGILDNIFDGIERPLKAIEEQSGAFISRGSSVSALNEEREWDVTLRIKKGDEVKGGDIYAVCPETPIIEHRCMIPPLLSGVIESVQPNGKYKVNDTVAVLRDKKGALHELTLCQHWPIRTPRPVEQRLQTTLPLITGQRVIDTLFPIARAAPPPSPAVSERAKP